MKHAFWICLVVVPWSFRAQDTPASCEKIFSESEEQWLCHELIHADPDYYQCTSLQNKGPVIPNGRPSMSTQRRLDLTELYFPGGDCQRFLMLMSLCDLYFPLIERKLASHQLPERFKYLPMVMSGLNPHWCDPADRCGLWGMDYLVARSIHLRVDSLIDERRGADFTIDAVCLNLSELYNRFEQDEEKTLIAWKYSVPFAVHHPWPSDEQAQYFLDLFYFTEELFESNLAGNKLDLCFDILGEYENLFFKKPVHLAALEAMMKLDVSALHATNPVYVGDEIDPLFRKVPFILLREDAARFRLIEDSLYSWRPTPPPPQWIEEQTIYRVKKGDSLGKIAERNQVTISQIRKWNNLKKDRIYAGQKLILYKKSLTAPVLKDLSKTSPEPSAPEKITAQPPIPAGTGSTETVKYKVKSGDSLWKIANKFPGVTPEEIMKWNHCGSDIRPGQILTIYRKK